MLYKLCGNSVVENGLSKVTVNGSCLNADFAPTLGFFLYSFSLSSRTPLRLRGRDSEMPGCPESPFLRDLGGRLRVVLSRRMAWLRATLRLSLVAYLLFGERLF